MMEHRNVGASGLKVSTLGIGCNNFGGRLDEAASAAVVHAALDAGVTHFDTADVYPMGAAGASEEFLGRALGAARADVVVASKFGMAMPKGQGGSRRWMMQAVEASLIRLGTTWIDLLYLHKPDPETPIDETLRALDDLIRAGKVRYIASSNFAAWQLVEAQLMARELGASRFIATQEQYSLISRKVEAEVIPVAQKYGVGLVPFFPLESGILTGKYRPGQASPEGTRLTTSKGLADRFLTDANLTRAEELRVIAEAAGRELTDLAFAWLLRGSVVPSVIAGASTPAQVNRNARAVAWNVPPDVVAAVA
jgi:aryl-alcohol dehydrogenase-like predicted oxidoreductase